MTPLRVSLVDQLYLFSSELLMIHKGGKGAIWDKREFAELFVFLTANFDNSLCFGDFEQKTNKIKYFIYILKFETQAVVLLLYVADEYKSKTKTILNQVKEELRKRKCQSLGFISNNINSSFRRWAKSLDAETVSINYKITL